MREKYILPCVEPPRYCCLYLYIEDRRSVEKVSNYFC